MNVVAKTQCKPHKKTKRDQLIALLGRKRSLTLEALSAALGWQTHTTRAAISRLRGAGFEVETLRNANGRPARYCLIHEFPVIDAAMVNIE